MKNLIPKIGLEIHLELKTKSKMFCSCPNDSEEIHPNVNICEICTGQPGVLPALNKEAVISAIKLAKALKCEINKNSYFARKNYFYPDLPKNYQISQYDIPLATNGYLEFFSDKEKKKIRLKRIHLEEDTAKLLHFKNYSLIDFNRAGIPLLEIVSEPDLNFAEEAKNFVEELILLIRYLEISNADPEKGQIRFEANISIGKNEKLGTRVEIKNLSSLRSLKDSIEYEIERQIKLIKKNKKILQETRGFDEKKRITFSQRIKEHEEDYRYFYEPDLPSLILEDEFIEEISLPELPKDKRKRFQEEFNLSFKETNILIKDKKISEFYERTYSELKKLENNFDTKLIYNFLVNDIIGLLEKYKKELDDLDFTPYDFAHILYKLNKGEISTKITKEILNDIVEKNKNIEVLLKEKILISNENILKKLIKEIIKNNEKAVIDYKKGKETALQFLIGEVMRKTKGLANVELTKNILLDELKND